MKTVIPLWIREEPHCLIELWTALKMWLAFCVAGEVECADASVAATLKASRPVENFNIVSSNGAIQGEVKLERESYCTTMECRSDKESSYTNLQTYTVSYHNGTTRMHRAHQSR